MIIFDIETGPASDDILDRLKPVFEPDRRLKDPEKITADLATKESEWKEKAALSALTGQILVVGYVLNPMPTILKGQGPEILEGPEDQILWNFWELWRAVDSKFVGFAIKHFDLPFLVQRSIIHDIEVPIDLWEGRWWSSRFVDLQERWLCYQRLDIKGQSLDAVCKACGLGQKNGDGAGFAKLWREDRPKALLYLQNDLTITLALAKRLGVV